MMRNNSGLQQFLRCAALAYSRRGRARVLNILAPISLALAFITVTVAAADVVRYTDERGVTHYVDSIDKVPEALRGNVMPSKELPGISRSGSGAPLPASPPSPREENTPKPSLTASPKAVDIYVTSWCPVCKNLEQYLQKNNVKFKRHDIENDTRAHKRYKALGGDGVPVITIGDKVLKGFNEQKLERALEKRGIRVSKGTRA